MKTDKIFISRTINIEIEDDMIIIEHPLFRLTSEIDNYKGLFQYLQQVLEKDIEQYKKYKGVK